MAAKVSGDGVFQCGIQFQEVSSFLVVLYSAMVFVERKRVSKLQVVQGGTLLLAARVYTIILPHHLLLEYFRRVSIKST